MLQSNATKRGTGLELWGDACDLQSLHDAIHKIAENVSIDDPRTKAQALILLAFAYEVRKAEEGFRLHKKINPAPEQECDYVGFPYLWFDAIFALAVLRYNAGYVVLNERDQANLYLLTNCIKSAISDYDPKSNIGLFRYIKGDIPVWDPLLFSMLQGINFDYLSQKASLNRSHIRRLSDLIKGYTSPYEETYQLWQKELDKNAEKLGCSIYDLDYDDYPEFEW